MQTILEYCGYTRPKNNVPKPESPCIARFRFQCANFACIEETDVIEKWIHIKYGKAHLYTCSEECYRIWLSMPSTLNAYSPIQENNPTPEIPHIDI